MVTLQKYFLHFVTKSYGNATVVFDGYSGPSIKDMTHLRPQGNKTSNAIKLNTNKFLRNASNKERLIVLISSELKYEGCTPIVCYGDAGLIIAQTAISLSVNITVTVIGESTYPLY